MGKPTLSMAMFSSYVGFPIFQAPGTAPTQDLDSGRPATPDPSGCGSRAGRGGVGGDPEGLQGKSGMEMVSKRKMGMKLLNVIISYHLVWWFGTFFLFPYLHVLGIVIPIDFHIFQSVWNHQPVWRWIIVCCPPLDDGGWIGWDTPFNGVQWKHPIYRW